MQFQITPFCPFPIFVPVFNICHWKSILIVLQLHSHFGGNTTPIFFKVFETFYWIKIVFFFNSFHRRRHFWQCHDLRGNCRSHLQFMAAASTRRRDGSPTRAVPATLPAVLRPIRKTTSDVLINSGPFWHCLIQDLNLPVKF